jgi:hypothetical protein
MSSSYEEFYMKSRVQPFSEIPTLSVLCEAGAHSMRGFRLMGWEGEECYGCKDIKECSPL